MMRDRPPTPPDTLRRARRIAIRNGLRYAYTGNVHDVEGGTTSCHALIASPPLPVCGLLRTRQRNFSTSS
jgi:hypothetical protein